MNPEIYAGIPESKKTMFILSRYVNQHTKGKLIKEAICDYMGFTTELIESQSRKRELTTCRQLCMYFMKDNTTLNLNEIGSYFQNRDHATVIYSIKVCNDLMETDKKYLAKVVEIEKLLSAIDIRKKDTPENK